MEKCIFCKIINKELPSKVIYEDEQVLAFKDINPQAKVHLLIVPKKHIESIQSDGSEDVVSDLILAAKKIVQQKNIPGYKLAFHVGKAGGQIVDHLHMHLLANICH